MSTGTVVSLLLVAGFVGTLGVLIKYFGMVKLVAGYDPSRVTDEDGLADFVGTNVLYVAALTLVVAVVEYTAPAGAEIAWITFVVGVVVLTARMVIGARRYEETA